ncbi:PEP-CTERM protein-sorting domain-containing protein [Rubritalea squalenifaciens DSM 18772]|uniref:PEP-CTERM protein-sorting domain-containing protein n=1 Tax=Rubritalea squalenifaciens DSM 18772 TaxID=1123071 RepID=A0A1M6LET2_9BACT|nr:PEP-CTERM sorting domain-containing protein [Rubritalea squalenifaciens]SHJ69731.1 PEP-CTERM protein-sorting domain-containing protein [Rubritalea squalenifaciens DSM 18772]
MKLTLTLAALAASCLTSHAAIIATTSFETGEGFPTAVTGGFDVTTSDGARWIAGDAGNYAGAWGGQALTGTQSAVIGNVSTVDQYIAVDPSGSAGIGTIDFNWERFTTSSGNLLVQWTTDALNGSEAWNTVSTIDITGGPQGGWTSESIAINQTGDVKVRLFLESATSGGASFDDVTVSDFTAVPEPSSTALIGLGAITFILRRRR